MSVSFPGVSPAPSPTPSLSQQKSGATTKPVDPAVQKFLEYANMTPAERMFSQMLSQLGLTEDQFKAMSPADQQKVEDKIRELVKQQAEKSNDKRTGLITDMSV
jgi:hypothetical protein